MPTPIETSASWNYRSPDKRCEVPSDAPLVQGKVATLQALSNAGFLVPEFIVCPGGAFADVRAAAEHLGFPLAVRSAATLEDGNEASFAGQFHTALNLWTLDQAVDAAKACRASLASSAVRHYCQSQGIDFHRLRMDVFVQRMISPELAGVAFTVNPVTGAEEVVIEAHEGLADELLSGRCAPLPEEHPLLLRHRAAIEKTVRRVQRFFGAPQDVEFAIADGEVYVLQARPITRIGFAEELGQWTNADFRDGGVSSRVCSPLMWSLYQWIWDSTLKSCLKDFHLYDSDFVAARMFFGRPYWNLGAVKRCLARLPGYVEWDFDTDLNVQIDYSGRGVVTPLTLRGAVRAARAANAIGQFFRRQADFNHTFLAGGFERIERQYDSLEMEPEQQFQSLIQRDYPLTEKNYFQTIFAASLAKMDFAMSFPDADYAALSAALPELRHMAPLRELDQMAEEGCRDARRLLGPFRHCCRFGLDICLPRWDEDREFVQQLVQEWKPRPQRDLQEEYAQSLADVLRRIPRWKHRRFRRKLERMRHFVWQREEMRDLSSRMYYLLRRSVQGIAHARGLQDDIFMMSFQEILADDRSQIDRNRARYESYRYFRAPNEIGARYGRSSLAVAGLRGIGASRGVAVGTARIARSVEEAMHVETGSILVCPFTDPGWTPVLCRVAGVVTETGGMLSHAAVICRELGVPAVLGVRDVVRRIPDGSRVTVDGGRGAVEVASDAKSGSQSTGGSHRGNFSEVVVPR